MSTLREGRLAAVRASLQNKLEFLRGRLNLTLFWPAAALVVAIAGWTYLFERLEYQRVETENTALAEAKALSRSYAGHLRRTTDTIDQLLLLIKLQWESSGGEVRLESFRDKGLFPDAAPFNASIVDGDGVRQTSTFGETSDVASRNVSDRPYFKAQKYAEQDNLYISMPTVGRSTGNTVIQYSRRLLDRNGQFAGVVLISVRTEFFTAFYDELTLGKQGFLGVMGADGVLRVTRIGDKVYAPQDNVLPLLEEFAEQSGALPLNDEHSFADGRSRFLGWTEVEHYPLIALAALDQEEIMQGYLRHRATALRTGLAATLALLVFTLIASAMSVRLAWRKYQLEQAQATYRKATEAGSEGFYIVRPVQGGDDSVADFQVIDCNERGAALFRLRHEEFIGRTLALLQDPAAFQASKKMLLRALKSGREEGEVEMSHGRGRRQYLYLTAARSGSELAVTLRDITAEKEHVKNLERRSNEDTLTGLPNRLWANSYLPQAVAQARAANTMLAVLFIDLDGFKAVNDTLGHAAGDEVLRNAARRLVEAVRPRDDVVRLGGDEFVVIVEDVRSESDASHVAQRVLRAFGESFRVKEGTATIGTSIGISIFPKDAKDAETLLQNADVAMYAAKTQGKNRFQFFNPAFYEALQSRLKREAELRHAIEHDQFVLYYQPRIDVASGRTSSMEALLRWAHPSGTMVEPLEFIQLAEETGLIMQLGELVIDKVCAQMACWMAQGEALVPVSINVSSRQFNESNLGAILALTLARHGIAPQLIELELTESTMMKDTQDVSDSLGVIHDLGIKLLVDDFGTGYSSLSKLQELDFDVLKVDKTFTARLGKSEQGRIFYSAIITMAHALGMRVVAEGVEEKRQLDILTELRCDEIQGFYIARPHQATLAQSNLCHALPLAAA